MERKKKKINLSVILLVAFWVISLALAGTLAWFTAKSNPLDGSLKFGTIEVEASVPTGEKLIKATADQEIKGGLLPGDDLTIKFSAANIGTEDAWALAHLNVTATDVTTGEPIYGFPIQSGLYPLKSINVDTQYTIPTDAEDFPIETKKDITYTVKIPKTTGNAFQGANVKVVVTVYAIQKRHMEKDVAYNEMAREAGYIVVKPADAQSFLNSDINGKTIIFTDGEYGNLALQTSKETVSAIHSAVLVDANGDGIKEVDTDVYGDEIALNLMDELPEAPAYHYTRNVNNVTFAATSGAKFTGLFTVFSKKWQSYSEYQDSYIGVSSYYRDTRLDPIRDIATTDRDSGKPGDGKSGLLEEGEYGFIEHINLKNIRFENMNFKGKNGRVFIGTQFDDAIVDNITFASCSFNNTDSDYFTRPDLNTTIGLAAIIIEASEYEKDEVYMNNISVKNCSFNNHYQGVRVSNANNASFVNNTFTSLVHNAINLQDTIKAYPTTGNILISGNTYTNISNRPIRFYAVKNATIIIENETYTNVSPDDAGVIAKFEKGCSASSIKVTNCYFDGSAVTDVDEDALTDATVGYIATTTGMKTA